MTKTITLIQFHNHTEDSDDRSAREVVGKWFIMGNEDVSYEFYDGDDEDTGESIYAEKDCVSYFDSFDDFKRDACPGYMVQRKLRYSTLEVDVSVDDEENINWLEKQEA